MTTTMTLLNAYELIGNLTTDELLAYLQDIDKDDQLFREERKDKKRAICLILFDRGA